MKQGRIQKIAFSVLADEILARDESTFTLEEVRRELGLDIEP